jgi:signal transduction histidine kinase
MSNALDAAGPGGHVQVRIIEVDKNRIQIQNRRCRVEVIDSGPGPPEHIAQQLFEPFVTGKPDGVGLGLALARQVAEAHGGTIGWTRIDQQTLFFVELPLQNVAKEKTIG